MIQEQKLREHLCSHSVYGGLWDKRTLAHYEQISRAQKFYSLHQICGTILSFMTSGKSTSQQMSCLLIHYINSERQFIIH